MKRFMDIKEDLGLIKGLTISTNVDLGKDQKVSFFSLGEGTNISSEAYEDMAIYLVLDGEGDFIQGQDEKALNLRAQEGLVLLGGSYLGVKSEKGLVYLEVLLKEEKGLDKNIKAGEAFSLKDLVPYKAASIVNRDLMQNEKMKFVIMSLDDGTELSPHRAPGEALVIGLEGKAQVHYEGKDYILESGQSFKFDKGGLHAVKALGPFKMALVLAL